MRLSPLLLIVLILAAALTLRMVAAWGWHASTDAENAYFRLGDSLSYWVLAEHIAAGEPYQYGSANASVFRAPLFPILLAPFTTLDCTPSLQVLIARLACAILGTAAVGLLMLFAFQLGGIRAACFGGALAALYPSAIGMSITLLSEALFMPLMLTHLWLLLGTLNPTPKWRQFGDATLAGVVAGLAILTRPSWLLFTPFMTFMLVLLGPRRKQQLLNGLICLAALSLTMTPWWVRNYQVTGRFVPTTLQVGLSLYDGLHEEATGASDTGMQFSFRIQEEQRRADLETSAPESTFEYRVDRRAKTEALRFAWHNPTRVVQLALAKFSRTWSLWPDGGDIGSPSIRLAITISSFSVLLLAIWASLRRNFPSGLARSRISPSLAVCWAPCIYFTLLHMVFVGSIRYREPAVFVLCALAGVTLAQWTKNSIETSSRSTVPAASNEP